MHFPPFAELPDDYDLDLRYYDDPGSDSDGITEPIKHWCLLVEIIRRIQYGRPVYRVRDKADEEFSVALYFGSKAEVPKVWEKRCKDGGVMTIMYATAHDFKGGQHGIRVEEVENVMVRILKFLSDITLAEYFVATQFFPCSLENFLRIGDEVTAETVDNKCAQCDKPGGLKCARCGFAKYCGKVGLKC